MTKPARLGALTGTPSVHSAESDTRWTFGAVVLSGVMVMLTLIGVVHAYSPVPFWDMWDGYVGFFLRVSRDGLPVWFEAHAEHHIVLSRLFFYADIAWFGGRGILPLAANLIIAAGIVAIFCRAAARVGNVIYPQENTVHVLDIAAQAFQAGVPAFGYNILAKASSLLGQHAPSLSCQRGIETSRALASNTGDRRIDGHLNAPFNVRKGHPALILDEHDTIAGWALVRPKGSRERDDSARGDPFSGYVRDPRARDVHWPITSLRICQRTLGASSTHSE